METTQQVKDMNRNPSGKGGFAERKHDISPGGWKKENTISYQYNRFINMDREQFEQWDKVTPKSEKTMAMVLAYNRVVASAKSLPDMKEITDRTEGRASQAVDITTNGKDLPTPILGGLSFVKDVDGDNLHSDNSAS